MRVLGYIHSAEELARVTDLLESRGVPVYAEPARLRYGPSNWCLFVCINAQYDDAVALLADENHMVSQPIDVEKFKLEERTVGLRRTLQGSLIVLAGLVLLVAVVIALRYVSM